MEVLPINDLSTQKYHDSLENKRPNGTNVWYTFNVCQTRTSTGFIMWLAGLVKEVLRAFTAFSRFSFFMSYAVFRKGVYM